MKFGFIGLGAMGAPMARNLLEAGHELAVWNRSPKRVDPLMEAGARRADSPADAASDTRATVLMITNAEAVQEVLFGDEGVVQGLSGGAAVINVGPSAQSPQRGSPRLLVSSATGCSMRPSLVARRWLRPES
jgi:3-hydroxyisobutyrate dehydrogenase-like beta-hydroxyacid dehydrogenase